jgi:hypothetical protein
MNICKRYRGLILTDYVDGEIDAETRKIIDEHLLFCRSCRQFKDDVSEKVITVFNKVGHEKVPESIWPSIKEKILQKRFAEEEGIAGFLKRVFGPLSPFPRLAPAMLAIAVLILVSAVTFRFYLAQNLNRTEQAEYIVSYLSGTSSIPDKNGVDFETELEEYFL